MYRLLGIGVPKETRMAGGTIKRLVRDRGFGFIRDDGGQEWFFHRSSVQGNFDQLNEGQRVNFRRRAVRRRDRAPATSAARDSAQCTRRERPYYTSGCDGRSLRHRRHARAHGRRRRTRHDSRVRRRLRRARARLPASRWPAAPTRGSSARWLASTDSTTTTPICADFIQTYLDYLAVEIQQPGPAQERSCLACASSSMRSPRATMCTWRC